MPFDSLHFIVFLLVSATLYNLLPRGWRASFLLIASYFYYLSWNPPQAALLLAASAAAYVAALSAADPRRDRAAAATACFVIVILGALAAFKYSNALAFVLRGPRSWSDLAIPLGISYYTFKLLSYVVDVHAGRIKPEKSFAAVAVYAAYFPQILSGPIGRADDFLPALAEARSATINEIAGGLLLILFGLFEKIAVADRLAAVTAWMRAHPGSAGGWPLLLLVYAYSWRLYADFAGLTDIAIGASRLFALPCPPNFSAPFYARNVQEFWRRWHMSLTSWLYDYVFLPLCLAFRRFGDAGKAASVLLTMLAVGVWHGAQWNFVVFGLLNGLYLIVSAKTKASRRRFFSRHPLRGGGAAASLITFNLVSFTFLFLFFPSVREALALMKSLLGPVFASPRLAEAWGGTPNLVLLIQSLLVMEAVHLYQSPGAIRAFVDRAIAPEAASGRHAAILGSILIVLLAGIVALALLAHTPSQSFIYMSY